MQLNYNIYCYKAVYDTSVPRNERIPFSQYSYLSGSVYDLADYTIDHSNLKFQSVLLNPDIKSSSLHYESGSISLTLFPDSFLNQYFFEPSVNYNDFTRIVYIVHIHRNGSPTPIWTGFFHYDNISRKTNEDDYGTISVEVHSVEAHFKEYYSNKTCPTHDVVFGSPVLPYYAPWFNNSNCQEDNHLAYFLEDNVFWRKLFGSKFTFTSPSLPPLPGGLTNFKRFVNNIPQLFSAEANPYSDYFFWIRSGFKRFQHLSIYDLFQKACNAHGWKWRIISTTASDYTVVVTNRYQLSSNAVTVDPPSQSFEYDESYWIYKQLYDYIIIPCGYHRLNSASTQGNSFKMITLLHSPIVNNSSFFRDCYNYNNTYRLTTWFTAARKYALQNSLAEENFDWAEIYYNSDEFSDRTVDRKNIHSDFLLNIDAGEHLDSQTTCDLNNMVNRAGGVGSSDRDLAFTGCAGDMFLIWNPDSPGQHYIMSYNEYAQSGQLHNNYAPLLSAEIKKTYELDLDIAIENPDTDIMIDSVRYSLDSLELNLKDSSSKIIITEI